MMLFAPFKIFFIILQILSTPVHSPSENYPPLPENRPRVLHLNTARSSDYHILVGYPGILTYKDAVVSFILDNSSHTFFGESIRGMNIRGAVTYIRIRVPYEVSPHLVRDLAAGVEYDIVVTQREEDY